MRRIRESLRRGALAIGTGLVMGTGLYPLVPHAWLRLLGQPRRLPWRALGLEWAAGVAAAASWVVAPVPPRRRRRGLQPVVFLHGYGMCRGNFLGLARHLERAGLGPCFGFDYWSLGQITGAAGRLAGFVEGVCRELACDTVDLVGHSLGGLVARHYVSLGPGASRVRHLITLGTPHQGTALARLGIGSGAIDLRPGSPALAALAAAPVPPGISALAIYSHSDVLVPDIAAARWPGARELVFDDLGHVSLLFSRRVARAVVAQLTGAGASGACEPAGHRQTTG